LPQLLRRPQPSPQRMPRLTSENLSVTSRFSLPTSAIRPTRSGLTQLIAYVLMLVLDPPPSDSPARKGSHTLVRSPRLAAPELAKGRRSFEGEHRRQGQLRASLVLSPMIVGFDMCPQPSRVYAREVRLVEINRPLRLTGASLAERRQIPRQELPLVTVQVVDREHIGADPVLDSAELATPHSPPPHPS